MFLANIWKYKYLRYLYLNYKPLSMWGRTLNSSKKVVYFTVWVCRLHKFPRSFLTLNIVERILLTEFLYFFTNIEAFILVPLYTMNPFHCFLFCLILSINVYIGVFFGYFFIVYSFPLFIREMSFIRADITIHGI